MIDGGGKGSGEDDGRGHKHEEIPMILLFEAFDLLGSGEDVLLVEGFFRHMRSMAQMAITIKKDTAAGNHQSMCLMMEMTMTKGMPSAPAMRPLCLSVESQRTSDLNAFSINFSLMICCLSNRSFSAA